VNAPAKPALGAHASFNYRVAKVLAIYMVVTGHWFGGPLWIPVTVGLFLFAFSSGMFTACRYGHQLDRAAFWRNKLQRLGLRYWIILGALALLLAWQGRTVLHWHSLVHAAGLSGFLNWFGVRNHSALGAGLWFFTLLLLFYVSYPLLARLCASRAAAAVTALAALGAALVLEQTLPMGHELWLTAAAFVVGVAYGRHLPPWRAGWLGWTVLAVVGATGLLNVVLHVKMFNTLLIVLAGLALCAWLDKTALPRNALTRLIAGLDAIVLEVFLIHMYLFVRPTGQSLLDFVLSVALITAVAWSLNAVVERVSALVFRKPPALRAGGALPGAES
jgi:hypothetical protein